MKVVHCSYLANHGCIGLRRSLLSMTMEYTRRRADGWWGRVWRESRHQELTILMLVEVFNHGRQSSSLLWQILFKTLNKTHLKSGLNCADLNILESWKLNLGILSMIQIHLMLFLKMMKKFKNISAVDEASAPLTLTTLIQRVNGHVLKKTVFEHLQVDDPIISSNIIDVLSFCFHVWIVFLVKSQVEVALCFSGDVRVRMQLWVALLIVHIVNMNTTFHNHNQEFVVEKTLFAKYSHEYVIESVLSEIKVWMKRTNNSLITNVVWEELWLCHGFLLIINVLTKKSTDLTNILMKHGSKC